MRAQDALHLRLHALTRKRRSKPTHPLHRGLDRAKRINFQHVAKDFRHRAGASALRAKSIEQFASSFFLLRVLVVRRVSFMPTPALVPVIAAIVRIPAEHVPQFRPGQRFSATQHTRGKEPGPCTARRLKLLGRHHTQMRQEPPQPGNAQPRGADMPPLPAKTPSLRGKAIVRGKYDRATAEKLRCLLVCHIQYRPSDRTVADIEREM